MCFTFILEWKNKQALPNNFLGHCPKKSSEYKLIDGKCCYDESDCCWDKCTRNPPPMDAFEYIPGGKWIKNGESYKAYSGKNIKYIYCLMVQCLFC